MMASTNMNHSSSLPGDDSSPAMTGGTNGEPSPTPTPQGTRTPLWNMHRRELAYGTPVHTHGSSSRAGSNTRGSDMMSEGTPTRAADDSAEALFRRMEAMRQQIVRHKTEIEHLSLTVGALEHLARVRRELPDATPPLPRGDYNSTAAAKTFLTVPSAQAWALSVPAMSVGTPRRRSMGRTLGALSQRILPQATEVLGSALDCIEGRYNVSGGHHGPVRRREGDDGSDGVAVNDWDTDEAVDEFYREQRMFAMHGLSDGSLDGTFAMSWSLDGSDGEPHHASGVDNGVDNGVDAQPSPGRSQGAASAAATNMHIGSSPGGPSLASEPEQRPSPRGGSANWTVVDTGGKNHFVGSPRDDLANWAVADANDASVDGPRGDAANGDDDKAPSAGRPRRQLGLAYHADATALVSPRLVYPTQLHGSRRVLLSNLPADATTTQVLRGVRCQGGLVAIYMVPDLGASPSAPASRAAMLEFAYAPAAAAFAATPPVAYAAADGAVHATRAWLVPTPSHPRPHSAPAAPTRALQATPLAATTVWATLCRVAGALVDASYCQRREALTLEFATRLDASRALVVFSATLRHTRVSSVPDSSAAPPPPSIVAHVAADHLARAWDRAPYNGAPEAEADASLPPRPVVAAPPPAAPRHAPPAELHPWERYGVMAQHRRETAASAGVEPWRVVPCVEGAACVWRCGHMETPAVVAEFLQL